MSVFSTMVRENNLLSNKVTIQSGLQHSLTPVSERKSYWVRIFASCSLGLINHTETKRLEHTSLHVWKHQFSIPENVGLKFCNHKYFSEDHFVHRIYTRFALIKDCLIIIIAWFILTFLTHQWTLWIMMMNRWYIIFLLSFVSNLLIYPWVCGDLCAVTL